MNNVVLIGRLTKDPEIRYVPETQMAVANFTVAINRMKQKNSDKEPGADFPQITVFGKAAENCEKYLAKGRLVGIQGRIQTSSYKNKEGNTVYSTVVIASSVEFLEWGTDKKAGATVGSVTEVDGVILPEGFSDVSDDIPF